MTTVTGTTGNNSWTVPQHGGTFTIVGLDGTDSLYFDRLPQSYFTITQDTGGATHVDSVSGASSTFHFTLDSVEQLYFSYSTVMVDLTTYFPNPATNDVLTGDSLDNTLTGGLGNDTISGGAGTDTAVFSGAKSGYSLSLGTDGTVTSSGTDGTDSLSGIERLQFDDGTLSLRAALPEAHLTATRHLAKVEAYFLGFLGREATADEASQFTALLQANQSRVWWYDTAQTTQAGSLMSYLQSQSEYAALAASDHATIAGTVFNRLTGQTAPQALIDHYAARLDAGTLQVRGIVNKMLGELYLSPKGDGTLGTVAGFADNRDFLDGAAYRGYLDHLDAMAGIDIANLDASGNLVQLVGVTG